MTEDDQRVQYLRRYGSFPLAYSSLQDGMRSFLLDGVGYVPYMVVDAGLPGSLRSVQVLGDPICSDADLPHLLTAFLERFPNAAFLQTQRATAEVLAGEYGYRATCMGLEANIDAATFATRGYQMRDIRRYRNASMRAGLKVSESTVSAIGEKRMREVSRAWMSRKRISRSEMRFLARPLVYANEPDVRLITGTVDGALVCYAVYDPIWRDGEIVGYHAVSQRSLPDAPQGAIDSLHLHMLHTLRERGRYLSLGLEPLAGIDDPEYAVRPSWFAATGFRLLRDYGSGVFPYTRLTFHKERWRPDHSPIYFCSRSALPVKHMFDQFRLTSGLNAASAALHIGMGLTRR